MTITDVANAKNFSHQQIMQRFCVAPMLDWTTPNCRYFHRLLTRHTLLYTEMVTTGAILYGDESRFLAFNEAEHPLALQLGGSDPVALAECARRAQDYGYDEVNLNVGCPSDRVQNGRFGACLMAEPDLVAECVDRMSQQVQIPVTVKTRIGIDERDSYEELVHFISRVAEAGCDTFIIHARKAWLSGLSPKENREIPPLRYDVVYQIKQDLPHLKIVLNGGVTSLEQAAQILEQVDGVMIGREAYQHPYLLASVDRVLFGVAGEDKTRQQVVEELLPFIELKRSQGRRVHEVTRHILGLFHGQPGARKWRQVLSQQGIKADADASVVLEALQQVAL